MAHQLFLLEGHYESLIGESIFCILSRGSSSHSSSSFFSVLLITSITLPSLQQPVYVGGMGVLHVQMFVSCVFYLL